MAHPTFPIGKKNKLMTENIEAIVLGYTKFGENSVVVHTLSKAYGRKGFMVKVGKRVPSGMLQPLTLVEMDVTENPRSSLWSAKNLTAQKPLEGIRGNLYKNTMTLFLAEVLLRAVHDGETEDGLYDWCARSILTLDALETDFANFPVRFLVELAGAMGFSPSAEDVAPFAGDKLAALKPFLTTDFSGAMLLPLTGSLRNALCEVLLQYLGYHTECTLRVKSLAVLRAIYE